MHRILPKGMRIGPVQLWVLLLLSEKPMYGYEIIRELEKRFSGLWKPQTGTIYPALEKLETRGWITSRIEFRDSGPDRKHYAITDEGEKELKNLMVRWTKMMSILENYREIHESIFRFKSKQSKQELSKILFNLSQAIKNGTFTIDSVLTTANKTHISITEPITFKLVYAKENHKKEFHIEIEWTPTTF
jgi:amphi-Trp domain-containing protein